MNHLKNKIKSILILSLLIAFIGLIFPFSNIVYCSSILGLGDAIDLALKNNNTYKISLEKVTESRYKVRETWGMLWPQLSTDVSATRQWAEAGYSANIAGQYNISIINGQLSVNPGAFYNGLMASRSNHISAEHEVRRVKSEITINTIKLYYQVLLTGEMIKLREESLVALEENLKVITTGYEKGTFSKLDYLRAKVAFSNEKTSLINAKNDYLSAQASFNILINREINDPVNIDSSVILRFPDKLEFADIEPEKEKSIQQSMIAEALKNRPELLQISSGGEALLRSAKAAQSVYLWPSFFLSGSYGTSKSIPGDKGESSSGSTGDPATDAMIKSINDNMNSSFSPEGWNKTWSLTFGATYRWGALSPLDPSHATEKQLRSRKTQADYQIEDFVKSVKLDVQRGLLKLKSASNSILSQQGNVSTAEESLKVSTAQFRNGIIDNTKLLDANVELTTARTLYIQALYNYQVSRSELNQAIGIEYFVIK